MIQGMIAEKLLDAGLFLQLITNTGYVAPSAQLTQSEFLALMSKMMDGVFDEEINQELFEACQKNESDRADITDYINVMIAAEDQLLNKILLLSQSNSNIMMNIAGIENERDAQIQQVAGSSSSYLKINVQELSITLPTQGSPADYIDAVQLCIKTADGFIRSSPKDTSPDQLQTLEIEETFNILIEDGQETLQIEIQGLREQERLTLSSQQIPLQQYSEEHQVNQRINFTCSSPLLASACFANISAQLNNDIRGYYQTLIGQQIQQQQLNNKEKIQYQTDLVYIQKPYLKLLQQANMYPPQQPTSPQKQQFQYQVQPQQQLLQYPMPVQSFSKQQMNFGNQQLQQTTQYSEFDYHLGERQQQQQMYGPLGNENFNNDLDYYDQQRDQYAEQNWQTGMLSRQAAQPQRQVFQIQQQQQSQLQQQPVQIINQSSIENAKQFLTNPSVVAKPLTPIQSQEEQEPISINQLAILILIHFVLSLIACFDRPAFLDLLASAALFMAIFYNNTHIQFISFCQAIVFLSFIADLIFLYLQEDPDSTGCTPPDCPDEQVIRLNKGIKRVTLIVSFINTLVRALILFYLYELQNMLKSVQRVFSFGAEPLRFQLGGQFLKANPLDS